ncbi:MULTISPECIES: glycerophosphoryl diester phosphodiesterase membrane domain-containing protein [unclassified Sphingomonas]|uniref:glycerophosphoryl diester phosphodiesterase membrane domain-containing protein n=1 Tax=unclassified Sphingomonas TaxID=196159 RepID=UPI0022B5D790|nr:glycerophosphoryl diester phosphodiesterase membrane domain-containing protein [Sphingomonas sp. NIBR02145]WHU00865.1 glycerophosphoryl diester phosphodiesterase membrane domain-containing protein [Sphingomonas sp. NIBR02145]
MAKMGTVWDRTAEFLSDNLGAILPVALLAFFVPASIEGSFQAAKASAGPGLVLSLYLVQLAFGILSLWGSLTITAMALDMAEARGAGAIGRARLLPALIVSVALFVGMFVLAMPIPIALQLAGYDMMAIARGELTSLSTQMAGGIALYLLVLVALILWLGARLFVTNAVIVREKRMFSALRQSWKLTRGRTWALIGVILLYALVSWVSILAANMVFGSIFALVAGGAADGISLAGVLTSIVVAAVQTGFTVLVPAFAAKLYLALTAEAGLREGLILA